MPELMIVWRNPHEVPQPRARRIQRYDFVGEFYAVQELVLAGHPELWTTASAFEVRTSCTQGASARFPLCRGLIGSQFVPKWSADSIRSLTHWWYLTSFQVWGRKP